MALLVISSGCSSPLWRYDRYAVEGSLTNRACSVTVNGSKVSANTAATEAQIQVMQDFMYEPALRPGQGVKMLRCGGLVFLFVFPQGSLPTPGRYRIVDASLSTEPGTAIMNLYDSSIGSGPWPFAVMGVHLEARDGMLQLDAMTDSTAHGTFRVIARRQQGAG